MSVPASVTSPAPVAGSLPPHQGRGVTSTASLVWRYGLCVISLVINLLTMIASSVGTTTSATTLTVMIIGLVVGIAVLFAMRLRWRHPLALTIGLSLLSIVTSSVATPATWAMIHLGTRRRWREIAIALAVATLASTMYFLYRPDGWISGPPADVFGSFTLPVVIVGSLLGGCFNTVIGLYVGARRDLLWTLHDRAETAVREQELRVMQGQAQERNRIAREMHDVLAHRLSLVSMHAGALAYRDNLSADETRQTAAVIHENAHASLNELRSVLGTLRSDDLDLALPPEKPQPTLAELPRLVSDAKSSGQKVDLQIVTEHLSMLPVLIGRHAYRIVQEGLTNARKHAPHTLLTIIITGAPGQGLVITMSNPLTLTGAGVPGAGLGLIGLAERAAVTGGSIEHGPTDQGTFEVTVWLPW